MLWKRKGCVEDITIACVQTPISDTLKVGRGSSRMGNPTILIKNEKRLPGNGERKRDLKRDFQHAGKRRGFFSYLTLIRNLQYYTSIHPKTTILTADGQSFALPYVTPRRGHPPPRLRHCCFLPSHPFLLIKVLFSPATERNVLTSGYDTH